MDDATDRPVIRQSSDGNPYRRTPKPLQIRLSITVPPALAEWVREEAKVWKVPVSAVVAEALRRKKAADLSADMIDGLVADHAEVG